MAQNDVGVTKLENGNWEYRFVMVVDGKKVTSRKRKDEQGNPLTTKRAALKARKEAMKKAQLGITNTAPTAKKTVEEKPMQRYESRIPFGTIIYAPGSGIGL